MTKLTGAIKLLEKHGHEVTRGVIYINGEAESEEESAAVRYLCEEWDYTTLRESER
jgi:virulence-associated protein VapD